MLISSSLRTFMEKQLKDNPDKWRKENDEIERKVKKYANKVRKIEEKQGELISVIQVQKLLKNAGKIQNRAVHLSNNNDFKTYIAQEFKKGTSDKDIAKVWKCSEKTVTLTRVQKLNLRKVSAYASSKK